MYVVVLVLVQLLFVVCPLDEPSLDPWAAIGKFFTAIVLDAFTPNTILTLGVEHGNACPAGFWSIYANSTSLVEQLHRTGSLGYGSSIEGAWKSRMG